MHLTCHMCDEQYKNMYYKDYPSLEVHFTKSHFICPYDECKSKCYVAFQTENEVKAHLDIMHNRNRSATNTVNATALLGFRVDDDFDAEDRKKKIVKKERVVLQDMEGVDFKYYFTNKYQMVHQKQTDY